MKLILCGGGTAGHITPGLAIAGEVRRKNPQNRILFIGRQNGRENELISQAGFPFTTLDVEGLQRKFSVKNINAVKKALKAKKEAIKIISQFKPDAIIGTGGYVCWPVIEAGYRMKIPIFIHESNIYPGFTTRLLAKQCNKVFLYSEESLKYLPKKTKFATVGNPIPKEFFSTKRTYARAKLGLKENDIFILSFGGSLGAKKINDEVVNFMQNYSSKHSNISHIHATGKANFNEKLSKLFETDSRIKIVPFLTKMHLYMKAADVVICRSGAMTLTELSATGAPSILIPSPNVSANHQYKNAAHLSAKGAAVIIPEEELTTSRLTDEVNALVNNKEKRQALSKCIELFAKRDVENAILSEVESIIKEK